MDVCTDHWLGGNERVAMLLLKSIWLFHQPPNSRWSLQDSLRRIFPKIYNKVSFRLSFPVSSPMYASNFHRYLQLIIKVTPPRSLSLVVAWQGSMVCGSFKQFSPLNHVKNQCSSTLLAVSSFLSIIKFTSSRLFVQFQIIWIRFSIQLFVIF